jgi:solute carrier family 12 (potassium/chloride transporters), member 8
MVGSFINEPEEKGFQGWVRASPRFNYSNLNQGCLQGSGNFGKNMLPDYDPNVSWFGVFGIFFPTITGL